MKKLIAKLGKWAIVYAAVDAALSLVTVVWWYFSPWWPL